MQFVFWAAVAIFSAAIAAWAWQRYRAPVKETVGSATNKISPEWDLGEAEIREAIRAWPVLRTEPLFYICLFSGGVVMSLSIMGAWAISFGIPLMAFILAGMALVINAGQFAETVFRDRGADDYLSFNKADRSDWSWRFLAFMVVINSIFTVAGSMSIADKLKASGEVIVSSFQDKQEKIVELEKEYDQLKTRRLNLGEGRSIDALQRYATQAEELAELEEKTGKGPRYKQYQAEATKWRAMADDAMREKRLGEQIAVLKSQVEEVGRSGEARNDAVPYATAIEKVSFGAVPAAVVAYLIPIILGVSAALIDQILLLHLGDRVGARRAERWRRAAERANDYLVNGGMAPRYNIPAAGIGTDTKAITGPDKAGDTININLSESAAAKIEASPRLQEVDAMFNSVLMRDANSKIPVGRLYELFRRIKDERNERKYMNPSDFRSAVTAYCELLGIELISNQVIGYKIGVANREVAEAAE